MNIGIIGTRGIPNNHGGFEQFAEFLAVALVENGYDVTVYNSHNHPFQLKNFNGVRIIHCFDPECRFGTAGQFIYDLNCILDSRKRNFDIILQLGYTSSSIWGHLLPRKHSVITTNMDGLEWKRSKYIKLVQKFLKYAERLAIVHSDYLISDSLGMQEYLTEKYSVSSTYIPYGANLFESPDESILPYFNVSRYSYNMLIARLEPENSIETILDGVVLSGLNKLFLVIGKHNTKYGEYLKLKYSAYRHIQFIGSIYDINTLNNLRYFSSMYFHGHTVGGTNPSLLEAMASGALICANDNIFNRAVLTNDSYYFESIDDVASIILNEKLQNKFSDSNQERLTNNSIKVRTVYSWATVVSQYVEHFENIAVNKVKRAA
jgi:glycosyltransferase involved in cell wall biosynthesis